MRLVSKQIVALAISAAAGLGPSFPTATPAFAHEQTATVPPRHPGAFSLTSSVKVTDEVAARAVAAAREAYHQVLSPYARITPAEAREQALKSDPGAAVRDTVLQVIHQNLVYIVLLQKGDERRVMWIDAGNGKVLATRDMMHRRPPAHHPVFWAN